MRVESEGGGVAAVGLPEGAALHPWNDGFAWALPADEPTTLSVAERAAFDRDGFVVCRGALRLDQLERLTVELDALEAEVDAFLATQKGGRHLIAEQGAITFTTHAVLRSDAARELAAEPFLVGVAGDLLGPDVNLYWDQAVYKKPERPRIFPWHQDSGYGFVRPQAYLTCWVPLTEATVDNGCPWISPGVHRAGTLAHRWIDPIGLGCMDEVDGAVPAEASPGDVVVFSSLTPHLTGPNTTDAVRKAYIVQYAVDGTQRVDGDWLSGGPPTGSTPCDDPDRQFAVRRGGRRVAPPPVGAAP